MRYYVIVGDANVLVDKRMFSILYYGGKLIYFDSSEEATNFIYKAKRVEHNGNYVQVVERNPDLERWLPYKYSEIHIMEADIRDYYCVHGDGLALFPWCESFSEARNWSRQVAQWGCKKVIIHFRESLPLVWCTEKH